MENRINLDLLKAPAREFARLPEELAAIGVTFGGITLDRVKDGATVVRINAKILFVAGCYVESALVTRAKGRLARDMSIVTIPFDFKDKDGRHAAACFILRLLDETRAEKAAERKAERAAA